MHDAGTALTPTAHDYRVSRYLEMGFSYGSACLLAATRYPERDGSGRTWAHYLYPGKVERALQAGCDHATALAIFL